jgi:uncharacterized protein YcsI (UPF0317 family)
METIRNIDLIDELIRVVIIETDAPKYDVYLNEQFFTEKENILKEILSRMIQPKIIKIKVK